MKTKLNREYVIASNKHRRDDYLEFWGRHTQNEQTRDFGGYYKDFGDCESYTLEEIKEKGYDYPVFDINTSMQDIYTTPQFIIKREDIKQLFKPITVIRF